MGSSSTSSQQPPTPSDVPDLPPGSYEFVETSHKRNWKQFFEIVAVVVIAAIPLVLSLFYVNPSFERVYEVINPSYVSTTPSYQNLGGFIMEAKKIFQPGTSNSGSTITPTPTVVPTEVPQANSFFPEQSEEEEDYQSEMEQQEIYPVHEENYYYSGSTEVPDEEPTMTPTLTPTKTPTMTPSPAPREEEEDDTNNPVSSDPCAGKEKNDSCYYTDPSGHIKTGVCKQSWGWSLVCMPK
ncbi:MAG TPA: hypothetical protein VLF20_00865 [Patescibacteria group bacterium]|nr:hypothetical protein [Patescibacteria group bacterium]